MATAVLWRWWWRAMFGGFLGCKKRSESVFSTTQADKFPTKGPPELGCCESTSAILSVAVHNFYTHRKKTYDISRWHAFRMSKVSPHSEAAWWKLNTQFWPSKVEKNQGWRNASFRIEKPWQMRKFPKCPKKMYGYDQILFFEFRILRTLTKKETFLGRFLSMDISWHSDITLISSDSPSPFWQKIQDSRSRFPVISSNLVAGKMRYCCASRYNRTWIRLFGKMCFFERNPILRIKGFIFHSFNEKDQARDCKKKNYGLKA